MLLAASWKELSCAKVDIPGRGPEVHVIVKGITPGISVSTRQVQNPKVQHSKWYVSFETLNTSRSRFPNQTSSLVRVGVAPHQVMASGLRGIVYTTRQLLQWRPKIYYSGVKGKTEVQPLIHFKDRNRMLHQCIGKLTFEIELYGCCSAYRCVQSALFLSSQRTRKLTQENLMQV